MRPSTKETVSRREFLRSSARYGWLLGLGAALAWLTTRRGDNPQCSSTSPCVMCPAFNDCALPPALTNRDKVADQSNPSRPAESSNATPATP